MMFEKQIIYSLNKFTQFETLPRTNLYTVVYKRPNKRIIGVCTTAVLGKMRSSYRIVNRRI
jgi:hypothetical protein